MVFPIPTIVRQNHAVIIEFLGKYSRVMYPGFNIRWLGLEKQAAVVNYETKRPMQFEFTVNTKDGSFCKVVGVIKYSIPKVDQDIFNSHYSLKDPLSQINAHVENIVRPCCKKQNLDELLASKDIISDTVKEQMAEKMEPHGYIVCDTLITDITPSKEVVNAMNEINASQRRLDAAKNNAEAEKVAIVARAEAEADKMKLLGQGVASQRAAIMEGYQAIIKNFSGLGVGDASEAMQLVLASQRIDAWKELATSPNAKVIISTDMASSTSSSCNAAGIDSLSQLQDRLIKANHA